MKRTILSSLVAWAVLFAPTVGSANAATDPGVACAVAKQKAAAKKFSDKVKCHGTAMKKGVDVDPQCVMKAEAKFDASFAKAEEKSGCVTTDDATLIEAAIDAALASLLAALPPFKATTTSTTTTTIGTGGSTWELCDTCIDVVCAAEQAACDDACLGIQACIESVCSALTGSMEQGQCSVYCEGLYGSVAKMHHLDVVNCAFMAPNASCSACSAYPSDYHDCRAYMDANVCQTELTGCATSVDCQAYKSCTASCTTESDCVACSGTAESFAGRTLLETYEKCVASECLAEVWLP